MQHRILVFLLSTIAILATAECSRAQKGPTVLPAGFFAGLTEHPQLPLERRAKMEIERHWKQGSKRYVRCELQNGKVFTGPVVAVNNESFELRSGVMAEQTIRYSELASEPQALDATGEKFLRGIATAGVVVVVVLAIPFIAPYYALKCAGGTCVS